MDSWIQNGSIYYWMNCWADMWKAKHGLMQIYKKILCCWLRFRYLFSTFLCRHQLPLTCSPSSALQWIRNNSGNIVSARVIESEAKIKTEKGAGWRSVWTSGVRTQVCLVHWWLWRIHCSMSSHRTWVTGPCSRRHPSLCPTPLLFCHICPPESNKGCPPRYVGAKKEEKGKKVKERSIPSDSLWSMDSNYSELIFSARLIPKWIKCGPHYCRLGAPLKRLKEDQGCGL